MIESKLAQNHLPSGIVSAAEPVLATLFKEAVELVRVPVALQEIKYLHL